MSGIVQRRPIILYEILEALYQQVNGAFCAQRREKFLAHTARRCAPRQVRELEEQMQAAAAAAQRICQAVDCDDPGVQFFFKRWETENEWQNICLAKLLVYTFLDITTPEWDASLSALRSSAEQLFSAHFVVFDVNNGGLSVRPWEEPGPAPELIDQLDQLPLEEEYRWSLFKALSRYPRYIDRLEELLRPAVDTAQRELAALAARMQPAYDRWESYFAGHTFAQLLEGMTNQAVEEDRLENCVNLSLLAGTEVIFTYNTSNGKDFRQIYMGALIDEHARVDRVQMSHEDICGLLRILSDRSKFEILHYIADREAYGQELARKLGLTTATISRHMAILQDAGLIHTRRSESRVYYRLNRDTLHSLLDLTRDAF